MPEKFVIDPLAWNEKSFHLYLQSQFDRFVSVYGLQDDAVSGGAAVWGTITGSLASQADLAAALGGKAALVHTHPAADITDFNASTRAQIEGALLEGADITITPSGSGATRQFTIATPNKNNFCVLGANYILGNNTSLQQIFNSSPNGAVTLAAGNYIMEALIFVTNMSATSGNALIDLLGAGTAIIVANDVLWQVIGIDASTFGAAARSGSSYTTVASNAAIVSAGTGTGLIVQILGMVRVSTAGTLIPSIKLATAAAASVVRGSFINFRQISDYATLTKGSWS